MDIDLRTELINEATDYLTTYKQLERRTPLESRGMRMAKLLLDGLNDE